MVGRTLLRQIITGRDCGRNPDQNRWTDKLRSSPDPWRDIREVEDSQDREHCKKRPQHREQVNNHLLVLFSVNSLPCLRLYSVEKYPRDADNYY